MQSVVRVVKKKKEEAFAVAERSESKHTAL